MMRESLANWIGFSVGEFLMCMGKYGISGFGSKHSDHCPVVHKDTMG